MSERIRQELALLLTDEVKDPGAGEAIVTGVEVTPDLRSANVRVRLLSGAQDRKRRGDLMAALRRATGMLRREVTQRLGLRYAPELRFAYDDGAERSVRVDELLAEIEAERRKR